MTFEALHQVISSSINLFFLKSGLILEQFVLPPIIGSASRPKKKELLISPIWGCYGPTGGSIFTPGQKNHPAVFEGRWYTGKMARQIWAEWAVCLSSYL